MGKFEVTQAQWEGVMGRNPSRFKGPDLPVEMVSWNDIVGPGGFLEKLNAATSGRRPAGLEFRLPREEEWEYACRAGSAATYSFGDGQ